MKREDLDELGRRIKNKRQEEGLSQGELARMFRVSQAHISRIERGEFQKISHDVRVVIEQFLNEGFQEPERSGMGFTEEDKRRYPWLGYLELAVKDRNSEILVATLTQALKQIESQEEKKLIASRRGGNRVFLVFFYFHT